MGHKVIEVTIYCSILFGVGVLLGLGQVLGEFWGKSVALWMVRRWLKVQGRSWRRSE